MKSGVEVGLRILENGSGFNPARRVLNLNPNSHANLRLQRVRELLKREIGEAVRREFHVSECGLISVNDVDVAGDLKSAVVFISILRQPDQQKRGFQIAQRASRPHPGISSRAPSS
jgi:hypothetical protein